MKKLFLLLLLSALPSFAQVQSIIGYVYDEAEDKPLEGAYVYLDGTTFSASTNEKGYFRITVPQKYNASLVVSYIGFETLRIPDPYQYKKPFKVVLREDKIELEEVVISNKKLFSRREMMRVFRAQFLGTTANGSSCTIQNEDDIKLYYDLSDNTLRARCAVPLKIVNKKLEYNLSFQLVAFEVQYRIQSLNNLDMKRSFYSGTTSFADVSKNGSADKRRKEAYLGSTTHLMRTIAADSWGQEKFELYINKFPSNPHDYLEVTDSLDYKKVKLNDAQMKKSQVIKANGLSIKSRPANKYPGVDFTILYNRKYQTDLVFYDGLFYIDHSGLFSPISELTFNGYMGKLKAGDLLPADYTP